MATEVKLNGHFFGEIKMHVITSEKVEDFTINICHDPCPESPREWDNLGTILYSSTKYKLGDVCVSGGVIPEEFEDEDNVISLPVYAYIHSGILLSTAPFSCPWDSGQCGVIVVTKDRVRSEFGWKVITKKRREKIEELLRSEIEIFSKFIAGEVYGFEIVDKDGEHVDSCWGFYSEDEALEAAKNNVPQNA
jgi:hypothetical protein